MEKFEFFPIKCRIQRAAEFHQQFLKLNDKKGTNTGSKPLKMKVTHMFYLFIHVSAVFST